MIRADGITPQFEISRQFIHLLARETIDDAGLVFVAFEHIDGLGVGVAFGEDLDVEILAVETGNEFIGSGELQRGTNILPHA